MKFIYINNFRGFSKTFIPLKQINFLVGENSTGKSSFLLLLERLNSREFWLKPSFSNGNEHFSFSDLVSAWATDNTFFQVGVVEVNNDTKPVISVSFQIHEFQERKGQDIPYLAKHLFFDGESLTGVYFSPKKTVNIVFKPFFIPIEDGAEIFQILHDNIQEQFIATLQGEAVNGVEGLPLGMLLSIVPDVIHPPKAEENTDKEKSKNKRLMKLFFDTPLSREVKWIAPIRTRPKRIYEGLTVDYSAEGEHTPLLLKKTLATKTNNAKKFKVTLNQIGEDSGLFKSLEAHSFGRGEKNPFELLVEFEGAKININNVGYGVSQVLPLLVEFLTSADNKVFSVQQPEVHLHPKAQASLGELIFNIAQSKKHAFFIETHSDYLIDRFRLSQKFSNDKV